MSDRLDILGSVDSRSWRWILVPLLLFQLYYYVWCTVFWMSQPKFPLLLTPLVIDNTTYCHENHFGNIALVDSSPAGYLSGMHLFMAVIWLAGLLVQRQIVKRLTTDMELCNWSSYRRYKMIHRYLGTVLCVVSYAGAIAGSVIAYRHHLSTIMKVVYIILLPTIFATTMGMMWYSGRQAKRSVEWLRSHVFWVKWGYVSPALASTLSLWLIKGSYRFGLLNPHLSEIVGVGMGSLLAYMFLVLVY